MKVCDAAVCINSNSEMVNKKVTDHVSTHQRVKASPPPMSNTTKVRDTSPRGNLQAITGETVQWSSSPAYCSEQKQLVIEATTREGNSQQFWRTTCYYHHATCKNKIDDTARHAPAGWCAS
jgi:hypothetical protein